jgi:hypothetical protein
MTSNRGPSGACDDRGAIAVIVALFAVVGLILVAFTVDRGRAYAIQSELQNTVDAAALAGAWELCGMGTTGEAVSEATTYAGLNGVSNATTPDSLRVSPPYRIGNIDYLNVRASAPVEFFFGGFLNSQGAAVAAQATAGVDCRGEAGFAIYAGDQIEVNGTGSTVFTVNGAVYGGGSGANGCQGSGSSCGIDLPNQSQRSLISGGVFARYPDDMKGGYQVPPSTTGQSAATQDVATSPDPVVYATDSGLIAAMNGILATAATAGTLEDACGAVNMSDYTTASVIRCQTGSITLTGTSQAPLKLVSATGPIFVRTNIGSAGLPVILSSSSTADGTPDSAIDPDRDIVVYGTLYAPLGMIRTNGHGFAIRSGRIVAKDFLANGNVGGFSIDQTGDPYNEKLARLLQ